LKLKITIEIF